MTLDWYGVIFMPIDFRFIYMYVCSICWGALSILKNHIHLFTEPLEFSGWQIILSLHFDVLFSRNLHWSTDLLWTVIVVSRSMHLNCFSLFLLGMAEQLQIRSRDLALLVIGAENISRLILSWAVSWFSCIAFHNQCIRNMYLFDVVNLVVLDIAWLGAFVTTPT